MDNFSVSFPQIPANTNICAVGIDMENVEKLKRAVEKHGNHFLEKVFTTNEINYCQNLGENRWYSFTARWAAKEAFSKAIGTGIGGTIGFKDCEIKNNPQGAPEIILNEKIQAALALKKASQCLLSLSHSNNMAIAIVLLISK